MGNLKSKVVNQDDDHDLTIINTQEVHTDFHISHELKLNIIGLLVLQVLLTLYKLLVKRERKRANKLSVRSVADLKDVLSK